MYALYKTLREIGEAEERVGKIDHPIRCFVWNDDDNPDVYDILPLGTFEGIDAILLRDGPYNMKAGMRIQIGDEDFQVMTWEDIEVDDFNWKEYLSWKH